jgi:peptide/nickel transport system substrate-binding protein
VNRSVNQTITVIKLAAVGLALAVLMAAETQTPGAVPAVPVSASSTTVTFAEQIDTPPSYIFPLYPGDASGNNNITFFQPLMWRPLYWFGHPNSSAPTVDYPLSLAYPPVFSPNGKTVIINLRKYDWSDGQPVTSRDVTFWLNLLIANHDQWGISAPGDWSTHIVSTSAPSPSQVRITFNVAFNHSYLLYNGLSQITPIPQHAWDKTSATGTVGSYDATTAGAVSVFNYLNNESTTLSTWDTNPLWQVVDGPYRLEPDHGFDPSTGYTVLVANSHYSGRDRPKISKLIELPFTSEQAEVDALLSGQVDYGSLGYDDLSLTKTLEKKGFRVQTWPFWGFSDIMLNFANRKTGPIISQLYVRQAMQRLIDESQYIKDIFKGYGSEVNGPAPVVPGSNLVSPLTRKAVYPYSVSAAQNLLKAHGWTRSGGGPARCTKPGSGSGDCGKGIDRGATLSFTLIYQNNLPEYSEEAQALASAFSLAGIQLKAVGATPSQAATETFGCVPSTGVGCGWNMVYLGSPTITYVPVYYPTGETLFETGAPINFGNYSNSTMNSDIAASHVAQGVSSLYRYENYAAQQLPALWMPNSVYQISVIKKGLRGIPAQDSTGHIYPEDWSWSN